MKKGFFLINIDVPDLEKAIRFYTSVLPLRVGRRLKGNVIELHGGPLPIYLLQKEEGTSATSVGEGIRTYQRHWCPLHFDIVVEDIESALISVVEAGGVIETPMTTHPWGKIATVRDPFGHGFCVIRFSHSGYDELELTDH